MFLTKAGNQQQSQNFYDRQDGLVGCCLKTNAQIFAKTKTSEHNFKCFWQKLKPDTAFLYLKVLWWWNMHRCTDGTCCYISSKPREQPCHHPRWPEATQGDRRPPARETSDNVVTEGYTFWLFSVQYQNHALCSQNEQLYKFYDDGICLAVVCHIFSVPMVHVVIFLSNPENSHQSQVAGSHPAGPPTCETSDYVSNRKLHIFGCSL